MARLDVPTWEDPVVSEQVDATLPTGRSSIAWTAVNSLVGVGSVLVKLLSQVTVLISVLREQRDGPLLAILCFAEQILMLFKSEPMNSATGGTPRNVFVETGLGFQLTVYAVWAATAADKDFVKSEGLKKLLTGDCHRKELVAGNLTDSITARKCPSGLKLYWSVHTHLRISGAHRQAR